MIEEAGGTELAAALEAGVLQVDSLEAGLQKPESMVELFSERLRVVTADTTTYAMFDEMASGIVTAGAAEGIFSIAPATKAKMGEARMGAEIVARLPVFPAANMQDILEVRDGLSKELVRFRRAVARLRELAETSPLNPDFADEADRIYRDEVEPALTEISGILGEGSALTKALLASGAIATVAAVLLALPALPHALVELLAGGAGAGLIGKAREDWERKNQRARGNDLFFLYEVGRQIEVKRCITLF